MFRTFLILSLLTGLVVTIVDYHRVKLWNLKFSFDKYDGVPAPPPAAVATGTPAPSSAWAIRSSSDRSPSSSAVPFPPPSAVRQERKQESEQSKQQQHKQQRAPKPPSNDASPRILMITYVFGPEAANKQYLRMFVETARFSGIDILIVGEPVPPFFQKENNILPPPPSNVRHLLVSWNEFVDRVSTHVFHGKDRYNSSTNNNTSTLSILDTLRDPYLRYVFKVVDFKPLFAVLFPEQVATYDWWGHLDNDLLLGNIRQLLTSASTTTTTTTTVSNGDNEETRGKKKKKKETTNLLQDYDIISGLADYYAWGPFTLFRNKPLINQLFRYAERPLQDIFATNDYFWFDEWGGPEGKFYSSTMAGIIEKYHQQLGIRWYGGLPHVWDGSCMFYNGDSCGECRLIRSPSSGSSNNKSVAEKAGEPQFYTKQRLIKHCLEGAPCEKDVALCHFQFSKSAMEASLVNASATVREADNSALQLWKTGRIRVNFTDGFTSLP